MSDQVSPITVTGGGATMAASQIPTTRQHILQFGTRKKSWRSPWALYSEGARIVGRLRREGWTSVDCLGHDRPPEQPSRWNSIRARSRWSCRASSKWPD